MDNGCGTLGHHAQHHVEQELGLGHTILALYHFMPGCHAKAVDQKLKVVKVCSCVHKFLNNSLWVIYFISSVEGVWTAWGPWSNCSSACGQGTQSRTRNFTGGMPCTGNATDVQTCQSELASKSIVLINSIFDGGP